LPTVPTGPEPTQALLVSACLLGVPCNHRGSSSSSVSVQGLASRYRLIPVCPETMGGLPTPRPAAEIQADGSVRSSSSEDVTTFYARGAAATVELAARMGITEAVLKARSPSCGCGSVYDGSFSRTLRAGNGVTAAALIAAGVHVRSEEDAPLAL
jgi:uncharacterized protein YbbK (DUF523 family)